MTNKDLPVNEDLNFDEDFIIERCPHDAQNPYTMVHNDLIRDSSISPECRWLIIYLLSNKSSWTINIKQICNHLKGFAGKNKVYDLIKEAIEFGYMRRETIKKGNLKQQTKYFISEKPKLKKCFRYPEIRDTESRDPENSDDKERTCVKKEHIQEVITPPIPPHSANAEAANAAEMKVLIPPEVKPKRSRTPSDFTPRVKELGDKMLNFLVAANPDWLIPKNLQAFLTQIDLIINHDKRDPERVLNVFLWAISDSFWMPVISTNNPAKYLRDKFAKLAAKMDEKPPIKPNSFSVCSKPSEALKTMQQMKSRSI